MARLSEHGIRLSSMSPSFLNSNSTSHTWPFSAVAELIDNASDPGVTAKQIWLDVVEVEGHVCLTFTDNGSGMTPSKLHKMLSFGFTEKGSGKGGHQAIGVYGNGFKSGSMRLGRDALIFTRNGGCQTVGMLSQSYLQAVRAQAVIVPMVPFNQQTKALVVTEDSEASLRAILEHSLLTTQEQLLDHFDTIPAKKGTKILIWNIRRNKDGKPELDFETDQFDIRMPEVQSEDVKQGRKNFPGPQRRDQSSPEMDSSLRAYLSILYLKPRTQIILRQKKVPTKLVAKSLSHIENDVYKPQFNKERVKVTFGFNAKNKDQYGIMMYHNNRLIKSYEKVGVQIKSSGQRAGVGVIGVIECNFLKPAHNKQDFEYTKEYRLTLLALGLKLNDYWRERREKTGREREFKVAQTRTLEDSDDEEEEEEGEEVEEEEVEEGPVFLQCEECLKWRRVPKGHYTSVPEHWNCSQNPNPRFRSCIWPEDVEESEEDLTPSYHKTHKKTEHGHVRKRGKSMEATQKRHRVLYRVVSEPLSLAQNPPDPALTHTDEHTHPQGGSGSEEDEEEEEEDTQGGGEDSVAHCSNKRKAKWPPSKVYKRLRPRAEPQQASDETGGEEQPAKDAGDAQPLVERERGESTPRVERPPRVGPAQPSSSLAWQHSLPPAQTVVVSPLSRVEGPGTTPLSPERGGRAALLQRLEVLEKEAKRLRRVLGMAATATEAGHKPTGGAETPVATATKTDSGQAEWRESMEVSGAEAPGPGREEAPGPGREEAPGPGREEAPGPGREEAPPQRGLPGQEERPQQGPILRRDKAGTQSTTRQADNGACGHKETSALQDELHRLRGNVVALLSAILPHVDLQGISLDGDDVDGVLQQIIDANSLQP